VAGLVTNLSARLAEACLFSRYGQTILLGFPKFGRQGFTLSFLVCEGMFQFGNAHIFNCQLFIPLSEESFQPGNLGNCTGVQYF
jgi:hypothetical protein